MTIRRTAVGQCDQLTTTRKQQPMITGTVCEYDRQTDKQTAKGRQAGKQADIHVYSQRFTYTLGHDY